MSCDGVKPLDGMFAKVLDAASLHKCLIVEGSSPTLTSDPTDLAEVKGDN